MYHNSALVLLLILASNVLGHNCTSCGKKTNVHEVPLDYTSEYSRERSRSLNKQWMDIRVFVDTSMLMSDTETCDRKGKYVRVGLPPEDVREPACTSSVIDDCWKLCDESDVLTIEKASYITNTLVPIMVNWLQSVVKVMRVNGNIRIPKEAKPLGCADHLALPDHYGKEGIPETDLVLIITGRPTPAHTLAWAVECAADQTGRPVFGHINIGPDDLNNVEVQLDYIYKVLMHEITHVLGFNSYKFPFYKDSNGKPYRSVTETHIIEGKKVTKVVTPRVLAAARDHFACKEMDGVPLEDGGGLSTSKSHWEKRIFRNEYMTGSSDRTSVISRITLALLEDMGWYRVDYERAEMLEWGRGMGCRFVNGRCSDWATSKGYFCNNQNEQGCTNDRKAMGYCNLVRHYAPLPQSNRYFPDPEVGGSDELSDYCPYIAAYTNGVCAEFSNQPDRPIYGENFGENSKCFESSLVKDGFRVKPNVLPMCYTYRCTSSKGEREELEVKIGSTWYPCPFDNHLQNITGFSGIFQCPSASFCPAREIRRRVEEGEGGREASSPTVSSGSGERSGAVSPTIYLFVIGLCIFLYTS